jgi:hypothetical protein
MDYREIRKLLIARPFQPFSVNLIEGRSVTISNSEFALISPNGRTLLAYEDFDSGCEMIDTNLIISVNVGPPPAASLETNGATQP